MLQTIHFHVGQFDQIGLNGFKRGQTQFSQLHISVNPDELESCNFVYSLITAMRGFANVICMGFDS